MNSRDLSESQLERLASRWKEDPSPHLSLQLADLYRRRGRLAEALPVLEKALEGRPGHLSVRVALGRYRLEGDDPRGAEKALLEVVDRDPGHLVANKLLVRAYLALGDHRRASDRLELYAVLNDSDPDLESLRAALARSERAGKPFAAEAPPLPAADLTTVPPPGERLLSGALDRSPFAALELEPLRPDPLADIFPESTVAPPQPEEEAAPPAATAAADDLVDSLLDEEPQPEVDLAPEPAVEAEPEPEPEPPEAPREIDEGAGATATLGALYLAQNHLDEAQATFEQVLARHPEDPEALAGLEEVARRRGGQPEDSAPEHAASGRNLRKIELLERYLGTIRAAADRLSA